MRTLLMAVMILQTTHIPLSASPFPDQTAVTTGVYTLDCHRWLWDISSGRTRHLRCWHAAGRHGDQLVFARLSPDAVTGAGIRTLVELPHQWWGTSPNRLEPEPTHPSCPGCRRAGGPPSSQSGWLCWRRGPIPLQEGAGPANGKWRNEQGCAWAPGGGRMAGPCWQWVPGGARAGVTAGTAS